MGSKPAKVRGSDGSWSRRVQLAIAVAVATLCAGMAFTSEADAAESAERAESKATEAAPLPEFEPPNAADPDAELLAARTKMSYRAPLLAWYGVALAVTWIPVAAFSGCREIECMLLVLGPTLRIGFAFGPPIVHWTRHETGRGFLSLGGQIAALAAGASLGGALSTQPDCVSEESHACPPNLAPFLGWFVADVVWAAVDVITTPDTVTVSRLQSHAPRGSVAPTFHLTRGGGTFGLGGAF